MGLIYDPSRGKRKKHSCTLPDPKEYSLGAIWQCNPSRPCQSYWYVSENEYGFRDWYWVTPFHIVQWYQIWRSK